MTSSYPPRPHATGDDSLRFRRFAIGVAIALVAFGLPLFQLVAFSFKNDLYSFTVLVPFISGYLLWIDRPKLVPGGARLATGWPIFFAIVASLAIGASFRFDGASAAAHQNALSLRIYSLVLAIYAIAAATLGRQTLRTGSFALAFLIFLAPFPFAVEAALETALQHASSVAAHFFFDLSGMPVLREGTYFKLPGFNMEVAPECSGIRSTLALFLTSLVAGQLFFRSVWRRTFLALVVIPVAIVRNGFRVFVIGELCVRISHDMIHHWIHRRGGPVFFALSLIPFTIILYFLYRSDQKAKPPSSPATP